MIDSCKKSSTVFQKCKKLMQEFIIFREDWCRERFSSEDTGLYFSAIEDFLEYIQQDDDRQQRRKLYEELKKEFEG